MGVSVTKSALRNDLQNGGIGYKIDPPVGYSR